MADMNAVLINRSLSTVRNELEFLKGSGVITADLYNCLLNAVPSTYAPGAAALDMDVLSVGSGNTRAPQATASPYNNQQHISIPPPQYSATPAHNEMAEALYDYNPTDESDLQLIRGSQVIILEKVNADWWRGRDRQTNREGIFPSSYVKVVSSFSSDQKSSPSPAPTPYSYGGQDQKSYPPQQYMPPQQAYSVPPSQSYAAPVPQPYYPPQQQQQQPIVVQQQQQQDSQASSSNRFGGLEGAGKKFGKKLGNAAIFGAGATIGADIVNSIF
ncbi:SH3 domain-containing protein [Dipodascopsis uninucleata]